MTSTTRHALPLLLLVLAAAAGAGCRPFAALGEQCTERPCAIGLDCVSGVCVEPEGGEDPDGGPDVEGECVEDGDCLIAGSADGRVCDDGVCGWQQCTDDNQCGSRICDDGRCAERTLCLNDGDCKEGLVCLEGTCRSPCEVDADCGGTLATCVDGRCEQQCFGDFMCFGGGICEGQICLDPECTEDDDCGSSTEFCDAGRCTSFVPCSIDDDCFDPDYLCNGAGRCEPRPACFSDVDCGLEALCRGGVCRPVDLCAIDDDCPDDDDECVAGRCVAAPDCRENADCAAGEVCLDTVCATPAGDASELVLGGPHGVCRANGNGPCDVVLFVGESASLQVGGLTDNARPAEVSGLVVSSDAAVTSTAAGSALTLTGASAGTSALTVTAGAVSHAALNVHVVAVTTGALGVLVVDAATGAPIEGAAVFAGADTAATDASGVATFATAPAADALGVSALAVSAAGYEGVLWAGVDLSGDVRVVLRPTAAATATSAGVTATVSSSGDEIGPVGLGVVFPSLASPGAVSAEALFGPTFVREVEVPVIGAVPLGLPASVSMEASLPVVGNQVIREESYVAMPGGIRFITAFESRRETDTLFGLLFGGGGQDLATQIATEADGADVLLEPMGDLEALPLVADSDDIDGDGELGELLPDWANLPSAAVTPTQRPKERVGVAVPALPAGTLAEVFMVGGYQTPVGGFVIAGMATSQGETSTQLRVAGAPEGLSAAERAVVLEARFAAAGLESRSFARGVAFEAQVAPPGFLAPPEGAFLLADLPQPGGTLLVLPGSAGATTYDIALESAGQRWRLLTAAQVSGGRSVALPAIIAGQGASVTRASVHALEGDSPEAGTATLYRPGTGPVADIASVARASASAVE